MDGRRISIMIVFTGFFIVGLYLLLGTNKLSNIKVTLHVSPTTIGFPEDPYARANYEWMRLRDPATDEIPPQMRANELAYARMLPTREFINYAQLRKGQESADIQSVTWSRRGPANVGGRTRALGIDVTNPDLILAAGVSGGMWRSTDAGMTWSKTTQSSDLHIVTSLVQDTRSGKTDTWYYGTGEFSGSAGSHQGAFFRGDGIFKSTDGGITWVQLPSTTSGTPHRWDSAFDYLWNLAIDPSKLVPDVGYAATSASIERSEDGGITWQPVLGEFTNNGPAYTAVAVTSTGIAYAATGQPSISGGDAVDRGIWRSIDGINWTDITPPSWPDVYRRIVIGIAPSNENVVYFLAETPGSGFKNNNKDHWNSLWKYTYVSGDGSGAGGVWEDRSANLPGFGGLVGDFDSQSSYDLIVGVYPDNEDIVFVGGTNLYRSTDGFSSTGNSTWIGGYSTANNFSQRENHHADQHAIVFHPSNSNIMLSGSDGGVSKTTNVVADFVEWISLENGYMTTQFYTVAIDHGTPGNNVIIGGMQDNGTWFTNASSEVIPWVEIFTGDGAYCAIADGRTSYYVSVHDGEAFRLVLNDTGNLSDWTRIDPVGGSGYLFINPFVLDPNNTDMMYVAGGDRIWRNSDLTAIPLFSNDATDVNWTELTNSVVSGATITTLEVSKTPANRLYYGTDNGMAFRLDGANAGNPVPVDIWSGKGFPAGAYASSIALDPADADRVLLALSNYRVQSLFFTPDGGASWSHVGGNLEEFPDGSGDGPSIRWAEIASVSGSPIYFVATSIGVFSTSNLDGDATQWVLEGASEIGNVIVDMIDTRSSDKLVVAATHGGGVFSANFTSTSVALNKDIAIPNEYQLSQNFPNPFNPSTTILFNLPKSGGARLKIYDALGVEVATLVDEDLSAGSYSAEWNANGFASGVYYYRFESGVYSETKKLILMK